MLDLVIFVAEGLIGTAAVLILPAIIWLVAAKYDREPPTSDADHLLAHHFLDEQIARSRKEKES